MQTLTQEQRNLLELRTSQYQENLWQASDFLEGRGLTEESAMAARLGVVDEDIPELANRDMPGNYLSIPYLARSGVVDIRYRCIRPDCAHGKDCPKYLTRAHQRTRIYGVEYLVSAGSSICVTEGELDALILIQLGYPAVAFPGAGTWKAHYRRLFEDFHRIVVFADGDDAGTSFGKQWLTNFPRSAEVATMDPKEDVNSMFLLYGEDYFHDILG